MSYGVATGSIDSREIKNSDVRSADLRNDDVRGGDIRTGTVVGGDVGNNSLTGSDILESTLGTVPSAGSEYSEQRWQRDHGGQRPCVGWPWPDRIPEHR